MCPPQLQVERTGESGLAYHDRHARPPFTKTLGRTSALSPHAG